METPLQAYGELISRTGLVLLLFTMYLTLDSEPASLIVGLIGASGLLAYIAVPLAQMFYLDVKESNGDTE